MADIKELQTATTAALTKYYDELDAFYDKHLPEACGLATKNVTDVRLKQVEADLRTITARMNTSPSFGMFLLDLAMSFIPVIGGHLVEYGLKKVRVRVNNAFGEIVGADRRWQLTKAELVVGELRKVRAKAGKAAAISSELDPRMSEELFRKYQRQYMDIFNANRKLIETREDLAEAMRTAMQPGAASPLFEFSTPVINDYFQVVANKLMDVSKSDELKVFANKPTPQTFDDYHAFAQSRFANSPNALVSFLVSDICRRQQQNNTNARQYAKFMIATIPYEPFLLHEQKHYTELHARLPRGNDLSNYILVMSEMFEAAVWMMFLGDPQQWFAAKDPKSGAYYNVPRSGDVYGIQSVPAYFQMRRNLPQEIEQHLLDTFHPDLESADKKSFRDYYRDLKKKNQPNGYNETGVDRPRGYGYGTPNAPDAPPQDVTSKSYTAEETALANLQIYFTKLYQSMKSSEGYFSAIMAAHAVQ